MSLFLKLFESSGSDQCDEHRLKYQEQEIKVRRELNALKQKQETDARQIELLKRNLRRLVSRGNMVAAESKSRDIASITKTVKTRDASIASLENALSVIVAGKQQLINDNTIKETLEVVEEVSKSHSKVSMARIVPRAMRAGQMQQISRENHKEVASELADAFKEDSDDEMEQEEENEANRILSENPTAVHTSTNAKAILKYAVESVQLEDSEKFGQIGVRHYGLSDVAEELARPNPFKMSFFQ